MFVELLGGDSTSQSGVLVFFFLIKIWASENVAWQTHLQ